MQAYPGTAVTDLGFRSAKNLKLKSQEIDHLFMGRSWDVDEAQQEACRKARAATEGCIAVAKHLRGFGRSLSRGLTGAKPRQHILYVYGQLSRPGFSRVTNF